MEYILYKLYQKPSIRVSRIHQIENLGIHNLISRQLQIYKLIENSSYYYQISGLHLIQHMYEGYVEFLATSRASLVSDQVSWSIFFNNQSIWRTSSKPVSGSTILSIYHQKSERINIFLLLTVNSITKPVYWSKIGKLNSFIIQLGTYQLWN